MAKEPTPCSQKQRRYILYLWSQIKLADGEEPMWKNISGVIRKPKEDYWNDEKQQYELNWLSSGEAYKVTQAFMAQQKQNKARGVNVVIKSKSEFAQKCKYCSTPIYWAVAKLNERIPIEVINGDYVWHNCNSNPKNQPK